MSCRQREEDLLFYCLTVLLLSNTQDNKKKQHPPRRAKMQVTSLTLVRSRKKGKKIAVLQLEAITRVRSLSFAKLQEYSPLPALSRG